MLPSVRALQPRADGQAEFDLRLRLRPAVFGRVAAEFFGGAKDESATLRATAFPLLPENGAVVG
jgi:hypothetical protein